MEYWSTAPNRKLAYANPTVPPERFCPLDVVRYGIPVSLALKVYTPFVPVYGMLGTPSKNTSPPNL